MPGHPEPEVEGEGRDHDADGDSGDGPEPSPPLRAVSRVSDRGPPEWESRSPRAVTARIGPGGTVGGMNLAQSIQQTLRRRREEQSTVASIVQKAADRVQRELPGVAFTGGLGTQRRFDASRDAYLVYVDGPALTDVIGVAQRSRGAQVYFPDDAGDAVINMPGGATLRIERALRHRTFAAHVFCGRVTPDIRCHDRRDHLIRLFRDLPAGPDLHDPAFEVFLTLLGDEFGMPASGTDTYLACEGDGYGADGLLTAIAEHGGLRSLLDAARTAVALP
jgi:hypothetical protein